MVCHVRKYTIITWMVWAGRVLAYHEEDVTWWQNQQWFLPNASRLGEVSRKAQRKKAVFLPWLAG